jgi:hypothetical protein
MAHFAQIDENGTVLQVIVVPNHKCINDQGQEDEAVGVAFCQSLIPYTNWIQTSYNGNIRGRYAGIGFTYDANRDAFLPPQPYPSWLLNEETLDWYPPTPRPDTVTEGYYLSWNEETTSWEEIEIPPAPEPEVVDMVIDVPFTEEPPVVLDPIVSTVDIPQLTTTDLTILSTTDIQVLSTAGL